MSDICVETPRYGGVYYPTKTESWARKGPAWCAKLLDLVGELPHDEIELNQARIMLSYGQIGRAAVHAVHALPDGIRESFVARHGLARVHTETVQAYRRYYDSRYDDSRAPDPHAFVGGDDLLSAR